MSPSLKLIIFDIDGTLVNSTPHCIEATNRLLADNGKPALNTKEYKAATKWDTPTRFTVHLHGEAALSSPNFSELFKDGRRLGGQFDELYVRSLNAENCPLYDNLLPALPSLLSKGLKLAALTNACRSYAVKVIEAHDLTSSFGVIEGADSVPASKPSPSGILQICEAYSIPPSKTLMVGDAVGDGAAGVSAGCRTLGVSWGSYSSTLLEDSEQFTEGVVGTRDEMWRVIETLSSSSPPT